VTDALHDIPRKQAGDYLHTVVKAALSAVPIAGGPASEFFSLVLAPPLERRRDAFLGDLYARLKLLEARVEGFHVDELQRNEAFVSAAMQATRAAVATHQNEKREYLSNALVTIAMGKNTNDLQQQIFLNVMESFSAAHVQVLDIIWKGATQKVPWDRESIALYQRNYGAAMGLLIPELRQHPSLAAAVIADLRARDFSTLRDLNTPFPQAGLITNLGIEFLNFVLTPPGG
jgi:hypothetical protein